MARRESAPGEERETHGTPKVEESGGDHKEVEAAQYSTDHSKDEGGPNETGGGVVGRLVVPAGGGWRAAAALESCG